MSSENQPSAFERFLWNLTTAAVLGAMFGAFFGMMLETGMSGVGEKRVRDEAVSLGYGRWEVREWDEVGRMGRVYKRSSATFHWNDRKECE